MSQGSRSRLLLTMLLPMAMIVGIAGAAQAANSELERELQRELHRMPPPALLPTPATLACYERLAKISHFAPLPIQSEPAQCATVDLVRLDRVTDARPDARWRSTRRRCSCAAWRRRWRSGSATTSAPPPPGSARRLPPITDLDSYECRSRNRVAGAKLSEHGKGNALDVSAIKLRNGALFNLTDPLVAKPFREQMRSLACARFTTVLGPGSDGYHSDHIHLDLAERSHGYRICQWNVLDPAVIAGEVPLPRPGR